MVQEKTARVLPQKNRPAGSMVTPLPTFDLSRVVARVADEHPDWSPERVSKAEADYRFFLATIKSEPGRNHSPDKDVDEVWHAHILFTRQYAGDCEQYFGHFVHHEPFDKDDPRRHNGLAKCQGSDCGADSCTACGAGTVNASGRIHAHDCKDGFCTGRCEDVADGPPTAKLVQ